MGNIVRKTKRRFFEGWYFKISDKDYAAAFIPSYHIDKHGKRSVFIQFINNHHSFSFSFNDSQIKRSNPFNINIDNNVFNLNKISLNCCQQDTSVKAEIIFNKPQFLKSDIMGIFRFVPFMECRHKVYFIGSEAQGYIEHNGQRKEFNNAIGYLESDSGVSFPKQYLWTHCSAIDESGKKFAIMLSIADIPYLKMSFFGCICSIYHNDKEYRLATYKGAKVISLTDKSAIIKQGNYVFMAEKLEDKALSLKAPLNGGMSRIINENISVKMRYLFMYKDSVIFDIEQYGGFEYYYDTAEKARSKKLIPNTGKK